MPANIGILGTLGRLAVPSLRKFPTSTRCVARTAVRQPPGKPAPWAHV